MKESTSRQNIAPFVESLNQLKNKLLVETDFSKIYGYFLDHLGENPKFPGIGKTTKHPLLKRMAAKAGKQVTGIGQVTHMLIVKVPQYPFVHGSLFIDGHMSSILYFEDIKVGLLSIVSPNGMTHFARITAVTEEERNALGKVH